MTRASLLFLAICSIAAAEDVTVTKADGEEVKVKAPTVTVTKGDGEQVKTPFLPGLTNLGLPKAPVVDRCALDGTEATNDMINAAVFIWAAVERCGKPGKNVKCEVDITSAITSITSMVNVVVKALHHCHVIKSATPECGLAVGKLARSTTGIAAAAGAISDRCPNAFKHSGVESFGAAALAFADKPNVDWRHGRGAICLMDLKDAMRSLIKGSQRLMTVKKECDKNDQECASNAFKILSAFAAIGQYVAGALGHCQHGAISATVDCAGDIAGLVRQADDVAVAGEEMSRVCFPLRHSEEWEAPRLFSESVNADPQPGSQVGYGSMNILLIALLPLTAVAAFARGARMARPDATPTRTEELAPLAH